MGVVGRIIRTIFFYGIIAVLIAFFLSALVEGIKIQVTQSSSHALRYFLISSASIVTAYWVFTRGRELIKEILPM
jgi:hypothetical protein